MMWRCSLILYLFLSNITATGLCDLFWKSLKNEGKVRLNSAEMSSLHVLLLIFTLHKSFQGTSSLDCGTGKFELSEECENCPSTCSKCLSPSLCTECRAGFWSQQCSKNCSESCTNRICSQGTGLCVSCIRGNYFDSSAGCVMCPEHCSDCASEQQCTNCETGFTGNLCTNTCLNCKQGSGCTIDKGICIDGCFDGFAGRTCILNCNSRCKSCDRLDASQCKSCADGKYGNNCENNCSVNCQDTVCNSNDGVCKHGCKNGIWGDKCEYNCPKTCLNRACLRKTGECIDGCIGSFTGKRCMCPSSCKCNVNGTCENCDENSDFLCDKQCSQKCKGKICHRNTTECFFGCADGIISNLCGQAEKERDGGGSLPVHTVVIVVLVVSVCALATASFAIWRYCLPVSFCSFRRQHQHINARENEQGELQSCLLPPVHISPQNTCSRTPKSAGNSSDTKDDATNETKEAPGEIILTTQLVSERTSFTDSTGTSLQGYKTKDEQQPVRDKDQKTVHQKAGMLKDDKDAHKCTRVGLVKPQFSYTNQYLQTNGAIALRELSEHLKRMTNNNFITEFQNVPIYDQVAQPEKPAVMLRVDTTPYLNACFIDGFKRKKKFIACSGPASHVNGNMECFWSMVWGENCGIVIMLTEIIEDGMTKCSQYWPVKNQGKQYGDVYVSCMEDQFFDDFHIRGFTIRKDVGEEAEERQVIHLHYNSWPENKIPGNFNSFTQFLKYQEQLTDRKTAATTVVHCSDGMGRTGTYVAIDILIQEGKETGKVNVATCVEKLRRQRTTTRELQDRGSKMVQTPEQYKFIYETLKNWFKQTEDSTSNCKEENKVSI